MKDRFLESSFTDVVVQGCARLSKEQSQLVPVLEHVVDRLTQAAIGPYLVLLDLPGEPGLEFIHFRAA